MTALRYGIIGTGAVGGYYGGKLAHAGYDVSFLLHSDYDYIKENGLRVDSIDGNMHIRPAQVYNSYKTFPEVDVLCIALKATQNTLLEKMLPVLYREGMTIVLMQNGLGGEEYIDSIIPGAHIIGGLCFICSNKIGPGYIHHLDYGGIMVGEYYREGPGAPGVRFKKIVTDFNDATIQVTTSLDLRLARWKKLVWNMPFNGLSVLFGDTRIMMDSAEPRTWAEDIMYEVCLAAEAVGVPIERSFITEMLENTDRMKPYKPSMMLDFEGGRAMELNSIYKCPLNKGLERGVNMDRTRELYLRLLELDKKNKKR